MDRRKICDVEFSVKWHSRIGSHCDRYHVENVDFWRDVFPGKLESGLQKLKEGESYSESFMPGDLVPASSARNIKTIKRADIDGGQLGEDVYLQKGCFYPQGIAWKPLATFATSNLPMRVTALLDTEVEVDTNHPLAGYPVILQATMGRETDKGVQRGGSLQHIGELVTLNGPGMQVPLAGESVYDVFGYPFSRDDDGDDASYYTPPRMVAHLDVTAQSQVQKFYEKILQPEMKVLDFMSSWQSHLSDSLGSCHVTGLGLNEQELQTNLNLNDYILQDLNRNVTLPFEDASFDAVICTVSIEYLCRPREIMAELGRVLRPGGILAVTISERWFPGKQIAPWKNMHPFERQGFVVSYFLEEPAFDNINTESVRGYPRPAQDKYSLHTSWSDSLYMVWAQRTS